MLKNILTLKYEKYKPNLDKYLICFQIPQWRILKNIYNHTMKLILSDNP